MEQKYLESSEFYSKKFNNFSTLIIIPIALFILACVIFSFFGKREITVEGMGMIEPIQKVPVVQSSSTNSIKKNYLSEGKLVYRHELLLTYNASQDQDKLKYYEQQKADLKDQKAGLKKLKQGINQNQDVFTGNDNFGYRALLKDYLAQRSGLLIENDQINEHKKDKTQNLSDGDYSIQENNIKLDSLQMQELEKVDQEQIENRQKLQEVATNIKNLVNVSKSYKVKAPKAGIIHVNEQYKNAQYIPAGSEIAEIYPILSHQSFIQLKSYISVADISSVKKDQKIRFKVTRNVPKPIIITGSIKNISVSPVTVGSGTAYLVTSTAKVSKATSKLLKYGMTGSISVITGKKTFFNFYKDKLLNKN